MASYDIRKSPVEGKRPNMYLKGDGGEIDLGLWKLFLRREHAIYQGDPEFNTFAEKNPSGKYVKIPGAPWCKIIDETNKRRRRGIEGVYVSVPCAAVDLNTRGYPADESQCPYCRVISKRKYEGRDAHQKVKDETIAVAESIINNPTATAIEKAKAKADKDVYSKSIFDMDPFSLENTISGVSFIYNNNGGMEGPYTIYLKQHQLQILCDCLDMNQVARVGVFNALKAGILSYRRFKIKVIPTLGNKTSVISECEFIQDIPEEVFKNFALDTTPIDQIALPQDFRARTKKFNEYPVPVRALLRYLVEGAQMHSEEVLSTQIPTGQSVEDWLKESIELIRAASNASAKRDNMALGYIRDVEFIHWEKAVDLANKLCENVPTAEKIGNGDKRLRIPSLL